MNLLICDQNNIKYKLNTHENKNMLKFILVNCAQLSFE